MNLPSSDASITRNLSNDLLLTVTPTEITDTELCQFLETAFVEAKESRGYAELEWLTRSLSSADGVGVVGFLAALNGVIVGAAVVLQWPERVLICALHVQKQARGVGVGSNVVQAVRALAKQRQTLAFALPGDRSTKNLYEQLGMPAKVIMAGS